MKTKILQIISPALIALLFIIGVSYLAPMADATTVTRANVEQVSSIGKALTAVSVTDNSLTFDNLTQNTMVIIEVVTNTVTFTPSVNLVVDGFAVTIDNSFSCSYGEVCAIGNFDASIYNNANNNVTIESNGDYTAYLIKPSN